MMFESILLDSLLQVALRNPLKREEIVEIFYVFCPTSSVNRLHLLRCIKSKIPTDISSFILILSILIQLDYPSIDEELFNFFTNFAFMSLDSPSPLTRTNSLRILKEVARWSYKPVLYKMDKISRLMDDNWWEVRAQGMCICADLLL